MGLLEIYYTKGGQGACPLKLKHFCTFRCFKEEIRWYPRAFNLEIHVVYHSKAFSLETEVNSDVRCIKDKCPNPDPEPIINVEGKIFFSRK